MTIPFCKLSDCSPHSFVLEIYRGYNSQVLRGAGGGGGGIQDLHALLSVYSTCVW